MAYNLLSKPAEARSQDLAALNTSLDHTRAIVTNPIANQFRVKQLQEDAVIMHQNPNLWRKLLGGIFAIVSAVSLIIGIGLAVPTFGASIGIGGSAAYGAALTAMYFFNSAAYGISAVSLFKGKQPVSNALSDLASDAEAINKHHNSVRR